MTNVFAILHSCQTGLLICHSSCRPLLQQRDTHTSEKRDCNFWTSPKVTNLPVHHQYSRRISAAPLTAFRFNDPGVGLVRNFRKHQNFVTAELALDFHSSPSPRFSRSKVTLCHTPF